MINQQVYIYDRSLRGTSSRVTPDRLIATTPTKEDELTNDARFKKIFAS